VMMAGYPSMVQGYTRDIAFRTLLDAAEQRRWAEVLAPIDGVHYLGRSEARFLLQFATRDEFVSRWDAAAYAEAIAGPKTIEWYATDHFSLGDASREARLRWLSELLSK
jgi:hypothetical protein